MRTPAVWITGAAGLIGHQLIQTTHRAPPHLRILPLTRSDLDLNDFPSVTRRFREQTPRAIIHCAALSKTPACEAHPDLARQINIEATRHLAGLSADIPFFLLSTDLVFDGLKGNYREDHPVNPLNVYAKTKVAAETIVLTNPKHSVIRTSLNFGFSLSGDQSFNEEMCQRWRRGESLKLFVDEYRCPISAEVTARAIWELLEKNQPGLYHLAGAEKMSRFDIGRCIANRHPQFSPLIERARLADFDGPGKPPDTSLDCGKIQPLLSFALPGFSAWLKEQPPGQPA